METGPLHIPATKFRAAPLKTMWRWWKTSQGLKSSWDRYWNTLWVKTAFGPLIRVMLYDSKIYGLRLVLQCLWSLTHLNWVGFHPFPPSLPFFLLAICPPDSHVNWKNIARNLHQWTHRGLQGKQTLPWMPSGETVDMCGIRSTGPMPAHPGKLLDDGEWGRGEESPCLGL